MYGAGAWYELELVAWSSADENDDDNDDAFALSSHSSVGDAASASAKTTLFCPENDAIAMIENNTNAMMVRCR